MPPGVGAPPPFMLSAGTSFAGGGGGGGRESLAELAPRVGVPEVSVSGGGAGGGWEGLRCGVPPEPPPRLGEETEWAGEPGSEMY